MASSYRSFANSLKGCLSARTESIVKTAKSQGIEVPRTKVTDSDLRFDLVSKLLTKFHGDSVPLFIERFADEIGAGEISATDEQMLFVRRLLEAFPIREIPAASEEVRKQMDAVEEQVAIDRMSAAVDREKFEKSHPPQPVARKEVVVKRHSEDYVRRHINELAVDDPGHVVRSLKDGVDNAGYGPIVDFPKLKIVSFDAERYVYTDLEGHTQTFDLTDPRFVNPHTIERRVEMICERVMKPDVVGGYQKGKRVVLFLHPPSKEQELLKGYESLGFEFLPQGKLMKRLQAFFSTYLAAVKLELSELSIKVVDTEPGSVLDGVIALRPRARKLIASKIRKTGDPERDALVQERFLKAVIDSFRGIGPEGLMKGHSITASSDELLEADIVVHRVNVKSEIRCTKNLWIGMNPHFGKSEARTNLQFVYNMPTLFPVDQVKDWIFNVVKTAIWRLTSGHVVESINDILDSVAENGGDESIVLQERMSAWTFARATYTSSNGEEKRLGLIPSRTLLRQSYHGFTGRLGDLAKKNGDRVSVPIPGSRYAQIFSATAVKMCGYHVPADLGDKIKYVAAIHSYVVSDAKWLEMMPVHGGCDQDDYFAVIHRETPSGRRVAIIMRSPMALGEYSVLELYNRNDLPKYTVEGPYTKYDWIVVDPGTFPVRIDRAIEQGLTKPGDYQSPKVPDFTISRKWLADEFRVMAESSTSPGGAFDAALAYTIATGMNGECVPEHYPNPPMRLEKMIDGATQDRDSSIDKTFRQFRKDVLERLESLGLSLDRIFAHKRLPEWEGPTHVGVLTELRVYLQAIVEWGEKQLVRFQVKKYHKGECVVPHYISFEKLTANQKKPVYDAWNWYRQNVGMHRRGEGNLRMNEEGRMCGNLGDMRNWLHTVFTHWSDAQRKFFLRLANTGLNQEGDLYSDTLWTVGPVWTDFVQPLLMEHWTRE